MGCIEAMSSKEYPGDQIRERRKSKYGKIIGRVSDADVIFQNVEKVGGELSRQDEAEIDKVIFNHYFFSSFSKNERSDLIRYMVLYQCKPQEYIFKQNNPGSLFFIIKKGKVAIEINDVKIQTLGKGQYFGEISLIYMALRSASVKAETECYFWCLHNNVFKCFTEDLVCKNYKISKPYIQKIQLFQFLSKNQINSIAYAMNRLKYHSEEVIFKQGDDANAFFIVVEGKVRIHLEGKPEIILQKGDSFGQNSFKRQQIRSGTAIAGIEGCELLSIGRAGLHKRLGSTIEDLIQFNTLKWALKRSKIFKSIPNSMIKQIMRISEIRECSDGQIIIKSNEVLRYFLVSIEGKIDNYDAGKLINQDEILSNSVRNRSIVVKSNIKKIGKGNIFVIPFKKIEILFNINIFDVALKKQGLFEETCNTKLHNYVECQYISNIKFENLIFVEALGEGQFGKVFLVKDSVSRKLFALKCIKKKVVNELNIGKYVSNQLEIISETNHPFIVQLERTFKDDCFVYFLMQYVDGIDFFYLLREIGLCSFPVSQFYLGCLILALENLHSRDIVYRDLKPENAVLNSQGFLMMIDLGTVKKLQDDNGNKTFTIIGTPHYMAPQILQSKGYGLEVDIWSLGVMLYEMVCGILPFGNDIDDPYQIYFEIMSKKLEYPSFYKNKTGKQFMQKLMDKNSRKRSIENFSTLKQDPYFADFNWKQLESKNMRTPRVFNKKKIKQDYLAKIKQRKCTLRNQIYISKYLTEQVKNSTVPRQETPWDKDF